MLHGTQRLKLRRETLLLLKLLVDFFARSSARHNSAMWLQHAKEDECVQRNIVMAA